MSQSNRAKQPQNPTVEPVVIQRRKFSIVQRRIVDGRPVYVKRNLPDGKYQPPEQARAQLAREVDLINRLKHLRGLAGHLGVMTVIGHDLASAQFVSEEVPGQPLQNMLRSSRHKILRGTCVRAFYLAGKWLRVFQTLPIGDQAPSSIASAPQDLVEYCDVRLKTLMELGYHWPSANARQRVLQWVRRQVEHSPEEQRRQVCCHGDYGAFNLMWDGRVLTPIDFGSSRIGLPLVDITYLIHHLEMLSIQFPWRRWPVALWKRACLRGYGPPDVDRLPIYDALMARHYIVRLTKELKRRPTSERQRWHSRWCRHRVVGELERLVAAPYES